ncbi:MAG TPA: metallophosphoesterase, partial [Flavisolibacter sp.]|nr:metallophosphoesterase [Flavisolibacter sp.]
MRSTPMMLVIAGLMILLDFYVFQIIKMVSANAGSKTRMVLFAVYWIISVLAIIILFLLPLFDRFPKGVRSTAFALVIGLFLAKLIASVFFLVDDIRRGIQWLAGKLFFTNTEGEGIQDSDKMSRSLFLSWLGLGVGGTLFGSLVYGFSNKYNYKIKRLNLSFPNLPPAFKGLNIIQLSDIHSGSFTNKEAVQKGVQKVMDLKPDLILFTGDLVNNKSEEMEAYLDVFRQLNAPMGVYSVLGNHDYGDYAEWASPEEKRKNLDTLIAMQRDMGWKLLMDENVVFERNDQKIALIGIQNWSALKRFPKYGNLSKAYTGAEEAPFKILMSHDPTHWDA